MIASKKRVYILLILLICALGGLYINNWYYNRYIWPSIIQRSVIGKELAGGASLLSYESFSAFGQGAYQWKYDAKNNSLIINTCLPNKILKCKFHKTKVLSKDITQNVSLDRGILIVEEVWS